VYIKVLNGFNKGNNDPHARTVKMEGIKISAVNANTFLLWFITDLM
jgi:hypothetical protein